MLKDVKITRGAQKGCVGSIGPWVPALPGPGKCGEYRLSSDPAFSRGPKKGEKKLAKDIRVRCVLIICWKMYMLEKNRFANFFLGSVNLPCCFAMLSKQNAFQALTNVEIC